MSEKVIRGFVCGRNLAGKKKIKISPEAMSAIEELLRDDPESGTEEKSE